MIWLGYKRPLVDDDLFDINQEDKAENVSKKFLRFWNAEKRTFA